MFHVNVFKKSPSIQEMDLEYYIILFQDSSLPFISQKKKSIGLY